ncbi:MAG: serine/threonine-protein kinase [Cyanobacteriota/Melainabacteria group bacterium]
MGESEITPLSIERTGLAEPTSIAGRYTVIEKLGQGGMGRVYSAHDSVLDRTVAIKILFGTNIPQDYWKRFQMEARAASKLKHPAIVQVLDFGVFNDDQPFLVMEHMKGGTLEDLLAREGRLPMKDAISIIEQICIGMEHAHNQQVLHRDLKPSNIIISRVGEGYRAHILDFGVAKVVDLVSPEETLTRTGQIVGSPRCMSPEQASGEVLDRRSDIYSLGCVAFELLSGKPPYLGRTALETIAQHMFDPVPSIDPDGLLGVPEYLAAAVERALAKSPADRYGTMAEFAQEIAGCAALINEAERLKQLEEEDSNDEASTVDSERPKLPAPLVISSVLVLTAIFLVGTWYTLTPKVSNSKRIKAAKVRIKKQKREKMHDLGHVMANFKAEDKLFSNPKVVLSSWVSFSPGTTETEKETILKEKPERYFQHQ